MSTLQQFQAIIDHFFGSDVELREGQNGTSELWAREGYRYDDGLTKFAVLYVGESLTDIKLVSLEADEPVLIDREVSVIEAFVALIGKLEDYTDIGHVISVSYRPGIQTEVKVIAMYEDVDFDEDGEPFTVEPPVIARFRWDGYQDTLSAR